METDSRIAIRELRVDGGATANDILMQFQSDILNVTVVRPRITETTALGAAYLAGLAVGFWKSMNEIQEQWQIEKSFHPAMKEDVRQHLLSEWHRAVRTAKAWAG
jgi:glycerol kinase